MPGVIASKTPTDEQSSSIFPSRVVIPKYSGVEAVEKNLLSLQILLDGHPHPRIGSSRVASRRTARGAVRATRGAVRAHKVVLRAQACTPAPLSSSILHDEQHLSSPAEPLPHRALIQNPPSPLTVSSRRWLGIDFQNRGDGHFIITNIQEGSPAFAGQKVPAHPPAPVCRARG